MVSSLEYAGGVVSSGWRIRKVKYSQLGRSGDCQWRSDGGRTTGDGSKVYHGINIKVTNIKIERFLKGWR